MELKNQYPRENLGEEGTWHRAIFPDSCPSSIFAATAFHCRVRDGSEWFRCALGTRKEGDSEQAEPSRLHVTKQRGQALGRFARLGFICCQTSTERRLTGVLPVTLLP